MRFRTLSLQKVCKPELKEKIIDREKVENSFKPTM